MKPFFHPVPIACLVIALLGAVTSNVPMVVLGVIAAIASVGFLAARNAQSQHPADLESLSAESRAKLRPVKRLSDDIEGILVANQESPTIQIIGGEAKAESERLVGQVAKSLQSRDEFQRLLRGRYDAEKEIASARSRLEFAGESEKASLNAAIEARTLELDHYAEIEKHLTQIDVGVNQAEAALAEMKARLSLSASGERAASGSGDDLRETISRLKNLSSSYDEADQLLKGS